MVQNSITIKAETIEEAVQTALNILQCTTDDINVQVVKSPSKSLFGLRKRLAEVSITKIKSNTISMDKKREEERSVFSIDDREVDNLIDKMVDFDSLEYGLKDVITPTLSKSEESIDIPFGAWIQNNKVYIQENAQRLPIIEADETVKVLVNGEILVKPRLVTSKDTVKVMLENEVIPGSFRIDLKDNNMMATLSITHGRKITRELVEVEPQEHLVIQAKETESFFIDIKLENILQRLKSLKIERGIIYPAIQAMLNGENGEAIIAKGISPQEGLDGDIEILIDGWGETNLEGENIHLSEKVDFREGRSILAVEVGQIMAKRIVAIPGTHGTDLFGGVVPPKPVYEVTLKMGKYVEQKDDHVVALTAGRPSIETRGKLVKIDVIKEYIHTGDVSLESGNIRFPGDVLINGNVLDSMCVEAEGRVYIKGTVNRAVVQSGHSTRIEQNVFSSELSVGKVNHVIASLILVLAELLTYLNHILGAINQILIIRRQKNPKEEMMKVSYLIRLLLEKKYGDFRDLVMRFCDLIEQNEPQLDEDWKILSQSLKEYFITVSKDQNIQLGSLESLIESVRDMYETYFLPPELRVAIELPYGINSTLYSSGNINIFGQGVYHCSLHADHNVYIKGVCRGGTISAGNNIFLDEVGSENGGKTTISVPVNGEIHINYAYADTVIQIGRRMHTFKQSTANIAAFLDTEGNLQLYK
ncbi:FapA family protein [Bacillus sp. FJAT-22090]|uniref:FapA family protein n=1 Tax=Bacillus sp. FJAT-22090 TaxID=1581038 RepID=UPI00119FB7E0|nr:FapA family protein [Bacillus sp. FJAT-22090]